MASRICATLSPTAGVGASDRSTMPKGTPSRSEACCATSWPMRVILKAIFLMASEMAPKSAPSMALTALATTPGPLTPTLITHSGSPMPWKAPAMNGLSSGTLANTTSLAQARPPRSAVSSAACLMTWPMSRTASMLMPALVVATLTEAQTRLVVARARGSASTSRQSPFV